jgi:hypothetical protein
LVVSGADQENVMEIGKVEEEDRGGRGGRRRRWPRRQASAGEGRGSGRALPRRSPAVRWNVNRRRRIGDRLACVRRLISC